MLLYITINERNDINMNNRKYTVCRDNIYIGEVVKTSKIYRYEGKTNLFRTQPGQLNESSWFSYRSMLFVPTEEKLSNDLLYQSPSYPILNITDDDTCLHLKESVVIKDACNLSALLTYFGYKKELSYEDILKIRKTFFTGKFAMDNCELFGWKEITAEDVKFYAHGKEITDPKELAKQRRKFRIQKQQGHRSFTCNGTSESILPSEYFDVLDRRGDNTLMDAITWHKNIDAFAPHKEEGPVKKLTRF